MPRRSKWTKNEWAQMQAVARDQYAAGTRVVMIARLLDCSESNVRNMLNGFSPRYFKKTT